MANVEIMWRFFDFVDSIIADFAQNDNEKVELLESFFFRVLCVLDGVEGPDLDWQGIALVASGDLPDTVDEINDDMLHDVWTARK